MSECNCGCGASETTECTCPAGLDGATIRFGDGVPTVLSTDQAGDIYIQRDSTPLAGEVWSFNGVTWTDEGFSMQGDTGADGAAGAVVIYNSAGTPTAFSSVGLTTIDSTTATLDTDGSYLEISNSVSVTVASANNHTKISVGGVNVWENQPIIWGIANQDVIVRVTRVNNLFVQYKRYVKASNTFTLPVIDFWYNNPSNDGVADMDTTPITITLEWGGIGTSAGLTVTKFVK